jgi:hypothetical protein
MGGSIQDTSRMADRETNGRIGDFRRREYFIFCSEL